VLRPTFGRGIVVLDVGNLNSDLAKSKALKPSANLRDLQYGAHLEGDRDSGIGLQTVGGDLLDFNVHAATAVSALRKPAGPMTL
jgi:hypothetical protein